MARKLATIRRIKAIHDIPKKDRIGLAEVDGWTVIVQKSEFSEGGLCVYCEIDSVLPKKPEFEFLADKDYRVRTMKMAGCVSQGICFPLSVLDSLGIWQPKDWAEGDDVTDLIGVTKWEREDAADERPPKKSHSKWLMRFGWYRRLVKRNSKADTDFPSVVKKTDEERIQNVPWMLMSNRLWTITEKIDGTSGTFLLEKKKTLFGTKYIYTVCSRNRKLPKDDGSVYWAVSNKYDMPKILRALLDRADSKTDWVAVQGECIAPKIQGNKYKATQPDLYCFNLIYPYGRLDSVTAKSVAEMYGLQWVPIVNTRTRLPEDVADVMRMAHGQSLIGDTLREGLVCRSTDGQWSFKAVDPEFLIKYKE